MAVVSLRKGQITVGWVGLEPTTNALKGRCSTIELPTPRRVSVVDQFRTRCKLPGGRSGSSVADRGETRQALRSRLLASRERDRRQHAAPR